MTAITGADAESIPSMHADESPRRPIRCSTRTRPSPRAMSRTSDAVPSGESSSTKISSHPSAPRLFSTRRSSSRTLPASLKVGTTTESLRALTIVVSKRAARAGPVHPQLDRWRFQVEAGCGEATRAASPGGTRGCVRNPLIPASTLDLRVGRTARLEILHWLGRLRRFLGHLSILSVPGAPRTARVRVQGRLRASVG